MTAETGSGGSGPTFADDPIGLARDVVIRLVGSFHEGAFRATKGRVFGDVLGMRAILLNTTGRRTGQPRSTMLTVIEQDADRIVVVASNGGNDRHPDWFHNVCADPHVTVVQDGCERHMTARIATAEERHEIWPRVVASYVGYGVYQGRTDREIPVVILEG